MTTPIIFVSVSPPDWWGTHSFSVSKRDVIKLTKYIIDKFLEDTGAIIVSIDWEVDEEALIADFVVLEKDENKREIKFLFDFPNWQVQQVKNKIGLNLLQLNMNEIYDRFILNYKEDTR